MLNSLDSANVSQFFLDTLLEITQEKSCLEAPPFSVFTSNVITWIILRTFKG